MSNEDSVQPRPVEVAQAYGRLLAGTAVRSRYVELPGGGRVHLLEKGAGPPTVLLHGTGNLAGFLLPLLTELEGVRVLAPDRPGVGLTDPIDLPRNRFRDSTTVWLGRLLDVLELKTAVLVGHSGGGRWVLWYALAHPDRVDRLVLIGPPGLPKSHCPWPIRLAATPGLGEVLSRLTPPTPSRCCASPTTRHTRRRPSPNTRIRST